MSEARAALVRRVLAEPLLHFLAIGAAVFALHAYLSPDGAETDTRTIVVDRQQLLTYIQYRSRAFDEKRFRAVLDSMDDRALRDVIRDYTREEALYREAKALGLDRNDYVARLRLIQQLEFVTRGFVGAPRVLTPEQIESYYSRHKAEYFEQPKLTFTHVFFDEQRHGAAEARRLAVAELAKLNARGVSFEQAPSYGERFLYHTNYVGREPDEIASHFGAQMQRELFGLKPSTRVWRGPYESPYGYHLVMVMHNEPGFVPQLEAVRRQVEEDATRTAEDERFAEAIDRIVRSYKVAVHPNIQGPHES